MDAALVFGGGGGKGAYEIGVWRALDKLGYADRFAAVFGTSVGALNAALFVRKKLAEAEKVWLEELDRAKIFGWEAAIRNFFGNSGGVFSQDGLREILAAHLTAPAPDTPDFYICTSRISGSAKHPNPLQVLFETEYTAESVKLNGMSCEEEISFLLASAAMPVLYPPMSGGADSGGLRDGGMFAQNNVPYLQAVRMGYEKVLAISLGNERLVSKRYAIAEERRGTRCADRPLPAGNSGFSDVLIVCPTVSLGNLWNGTLDFSTDSAKWREELGYTNCMGLYRETIERFFSHMGKTADRKDTPNGMKKTGTE